MICIKVKDEDVCWVLILTSNVTLGKSSNPICKIRSDDLKVSLQFNIVMIL